MKLKMYTSLLALCLAGSSFLKASVPSDRIYIEKVSAMGTGCPKDTAFINISPDKQVFTAIFSAFQAVIDPFSPATSYADRQKRCDLAVKVNVPHGWQFSVFQADYEGWYDLQRGITMTQTSTYHFQGNDRHGKRSVISADSRNISGNFHFIDEVGVSSVEWSDCGAPRNMFITSELILSSTNQSAVGVAGIDAIEGQFKLKSSFGIRWRQCRR